MFYRTVPIAIVVVSFIDGRQREATVRLNYTVYIDGRNLGQDRDRNLFAGSVLLFCVRILPVPHPETSRDGGCLGCCCCHHSQRRNDTNRSNHTRRRRFFRWRMTMTMTKRGDNEHGGWTSAILETNHRPVRFPSFLLPYSACLPWPFDHRQWRMVP